MPDRHVHANADACGNHDAYYHGNYRADRYHYTAPNSQTRNHGHGDSDRSTHQHRDCHADDHTRIDRYSRGRPDAGNGDAVR